MESNDLVLEQVEEEKNVKGEVLTCGVPVCGGNLSTPVLDQAYYIGEVHYRIGEILYIENAD